MKIVKAIAMVIAFGTFGVAGAQAESGPSKLDIAIVWSQDNCDGSAISEGAKNAAAKATAGMSATDHAAKASEIEKAIEENFDGDRSEYCEFVAEMAADL